MAREPSSIHLLIVDDNPVVGLLWQRLLQKRGFHVELAQKPEAGLHRAMEQPFDLILLDLLMPGMNGIEMAGRLRAEPKTTEIPVVFLSALDHADLGEYREQMQGLASGYLVKSQSSIEDMMGLLVRILDVDATRAA
jgi:CheY-like chemotaxis protein